MNRNEPHKAFTLIEVLIVVVIVAVFVATIIPQFSDSAADAKQSQMEFNLQTLRSQCELYKAHEGCFPLTLTDLTGKTSDGFGPFIVAVPENPFTLTSSVKEVTSQPTGPDVTSDAGWLYMSSTGQVWPNCAEGF
jgi:prepilin-type N-terminal cleavage/methylation domain-containing protein